jgi:hypothetical protein
MGLSLFTRAPIPCLGAGAPQGRGRRLFAQVAGVAPASSLGLDYAATRGHESRAAALQHAIWLRCGTIAAETDDRTNPKGREEQEA